MSKEFNIHVIAHQFIKHYYGMLAKNPAELHKFYMEDSFFMHSESLQEGVTVSGLEKIRTTVSELQLLGLSVDLSNGSVDAQPANGGVLIVVTGHYTPAQNPKKVHATKPFVQTFYLIATSNQAYYVSNSVFRLLSSDDLVEEEAAPVDSQSSTVEIGDGSHSEDALATSQPDSEQSSAAIEVVPTEDSPEPIKDPSSPGENGDSIDYTTVDSTEDTPVVETSEHTSPVDEAAVEVLEPAATIAVPKQSAASVSESLKKLNYSDIVKKAAGESKIPLGGRIAAPGKASLTTGVVATPSITVSKSIPKQSSHAVQASAPSGRQSGYAVYVNQLPEQTSLSDLSDLFGAFGRILDIDQPAGRSFAFIKFESSSAMKAAVSASLQAPGLQLRDHALKVEERNSARGGSIDNDSGVKSKSRNREREKGQRRDRNRDQSKEGGSAVKDTEGGAGTSHEDGSLEVVPNKSLTTPSQATTIKAQGKTLSNGNTHSNTNNGSKAPITNDALPATTTTSAGHSKRK